jgi:hypothetical protein
MHSEKGARACGHSGTDTTLVEDGNAGTGSRQMESDAAPDDPGTDNDYIGL